MGKTGTSTARMLLESEASLPLHVCILKDLDTGNTRLGQNLFHVCKAHEGVDREVHAQQACRKPGRPEHKKSLCSCPCCNGQPSPPLLRPNSERMPAMPLLMGLLAAAAL